MYLYRSNTVNWTHQNETVSWLFWVNLVLTVLNAFNLWNCSTSSFLFKLKYRTLIARVTRYSVLLKNGNITSIHVDLRTPEFMTLDDNLHFPHWKYRIQQAVHQVSVNAASCFRQLWIISPMTFMWLDHQYIKFLRLFSTRVTKKDQLGTFLITFPSHSNHLLETLIEKLLCLWLTDQILTSYFLITLSKVSGTNSQSGRTITI